MEHAHESRRQDDAGAAARPRRPSPQANPPQLSLLALQRSAGNAAVARLVQRQPATAEAPPQEAPAPATETAPGAQTGASGAPQPATGPKHATDWFADFDQTGGAGGKVGERGENDVLVVKDLAIHHGTDKPVHLHGFDAASSGRAHLGSVDHPAGEGEVSGLVEYAQSRELQVVPTLSGAGKGAVGKHQAKLAHDKAQEYVTQQLSDAEGNKEALEQGAEAAANEALAADAQAAAAGSGAPVEVPTAKIRVNFGKHTTQPALASVAYTIGAPSDCVVYVVVPTEKHVGRVSTTTVEKGGRAKHAEAGASVKQTTDTSVDVSASGSTTTKDSVDARSKRSTEAKLKLGKSFVRNTETSVKVAVEQKFQELITEISETTEATASRTTETKKPIPDVEVPLDGESDAEKEDKPWYKRLKDKIGDFVTKKVGGYLKDKFWSYADKLIGREWPLYRAIPGAVKDWVKRKVTDLAVGAGKWVWNKLTGGEAKVGHTPEERVPPLENTTENERMGTTHITVADLRKISSSAASEYSRLVSEQVRQSLEAEFGVTTDVDVDVKKSKDQTSSGSVDVKDKATQESEGHAGVAEDEASEKETTRTYTGDVVRIESGKPVIRLTVKPK